MKASNVAAFAALLLLSSNLVIAQQPDPHSHPGKPIEGSNPRSAMPRMDEQMKKMQALHDRMASAATPEERQKLMAENRKAMQEGMGMMNQMMHGGRMMGGPGGHSPAPKAKPSDPTAQMQMMQMRMDMMQMMMQMMMDQQGMTGGPGAMPGPPRK